MSRFHLRSARSTDAGRTGTILSGFIDDTEWMPRVHSRAQDLGFAADLIDRGWVTVAELEGEVVGFSARDMEVVHALYVSSDRRGAGCGSVLLGQMMSATDNLVLWTFQANIRAQAFYLRHGFVELERTDGAGNDEGLPDMRLEWKRGMA
ncbi:MAG: GNAT family N-acetyltransferase [Aestuariivita sp.]|uniref:GNAT family N-acetyltransferase n=1 Tax=Aestuariivita sp. TaxID=1872407 RepID=UPI003BB095D7